MQQYTFRIDYGDEVDQIKVKEFFTKYDVKFTKYLVYEEHGDATQKLHAQGIIEFEGNDRAIRQLIVRSFKVSGSKYSMALVKTENYEVYISKQKNRICSKGYTEEQILEIENASYLPEKISKHNIKNKNKKTNPELFLEYMDRDDIKTEFAQLERTVTGKIKNKDDYYEIVARNTVDFFSKILNKPFAHQIIENYMRYYLTRENDDYRFKLIDKYKNFLKIEFM